MPASEGDPRDLDADVAAAFTVPPVCWGPHGGCAGSCVHEGDGDGDGELH